MTYGQFGRPKQCQNLCGTEIMWDKNANYFVNTSNNARHDCPKWEKRKDGGGATTDAATKGELMEAIHSIEDRLTKIEANTAPVPMQGWMLEKVAKKIGVEDLINEGK